MVPRCFAPADPSRARPEGTRPFPPAVSQSGRSEEVPCPECTADHRENLERQKPRRFAYTGVEPRARSTAEEPGPIPPWRATGDSRERSREVRVIRETRPQGDAGNRLLSVGELFARPCDPPPAHELSHRVAESVSEQLGQVHGMDGGDTRDVLQPVRLHRVRVKVGHAAVETMMRFEQIAGVCVPSVHRAA